MPFHDRFYLMLSHSKPIHPWNEFGSIEDVMKVSVTLLILGLLLSGCELKRRVRTTTVQPAETVKTEETIVTASEESETAITQTPEMDDNQTPPAQETAGEEDDILPEEAPQEPAPRRQEKVSATGPGADYYRMALEDVAANDSEMAAENYYRSCEAGFIAGCHRYAWHKEQQGDRRLAEEYYRRACDAGYGKSCNNLGYWAEKIGKWNDAQNWYSWACLRRHPGSCGNLKRVNDKAKKNSLRR